MNLRGLMLVSLLVALAALWVGVATASATVATSPEEAIYEGPITAVSGQTELHNAVGTVSCKTSTLEAAIEEQGEAITAKGKISTLDFSECSSSVTVLNPGVLEFHHTSGGNGTVTSTGAEITVVMFGISCLYKTNSTDIGTLTGSTATEGHAVMDLSLASIPRTGHSFFCGTSANWTGSYTVTAPLEFSLDAAANDMEGHFVSGASKVAIVGTEPTPDKLEWTIDEVAGGIVCDESTWDSLRIGTVFTVHFIPTFGKCHTTESAENFEIKMNGCSFHFYIATDTKEETEQTLWLYCPKKQTIEIVDPQCKVKIPTQKNLKGVTYTKITLNEKHALTVDVNVTLGAVKTEGACGAAEREGRLEGSLIIEAFEFKTDARVHFTATGKP